MGSRQMDSNGTWKESYDHQLGGYPGPKGEPYPNPSGVEPRGRAVLIRTYEPELQKTMIEIPDHVKFSQQMVNQRAIVIAVGPTAWHDEPEPRAVAGEHVLVTKFAGFMVSSDISADGLTYRLVNDRDVFAAIKEKETESG